MTSNLANDEIASHALQLRKEASKAAEKYCHSEEGEDCLVTIACYSTWSVCVCVCAGTADHIEISREFKEQVVEPILKVFKIL